jgi:hypothetical protein
VNPHAGAGLQTKPLLSCYSLKFLSSIPDEYVYRTTKDGAMSIVAIDPHTAADETAGLEKTRLGKTH